jgi:hypothetical protein
LEIEMMEFERFNPSVVNQNSETEEVKERE